MNFQKGLPRSHAPATRTHSIREQVNVVRGQSLFELVVAIAISALIVVAMVSLAVNSIQNSNYAKNKAVASSYAQQAMEWLRGQRDGGIDDFISKTQDAGAIKVCLNEFPDLIDELVVAACSSGTTISGTPFMRQVTFSVAPQNGREVVEAEVTVSWVDSKGTHEVKSATNLADLR